MYRSEFEKLKRGDIVRHENDGISYVIVEKTPEGDPIGIREITLTNPSEWEKVK